MSWGVSVTCSPEAALPGVETHDFDPLGHLLGECGLMVAQLHSLHGVFERHCVTAPAVGHLFHSCHPQAVSGEG